ncbi:MAG: UTP--glucose-1-phosphate uridylyltransferase GalU [Gammaproteobacteria bacterium]|nr:UTP--glucose-1-phosphate uridylyltransferase GalU [Gammaproteobacteria bacterium]
MKKITKAVFPVAGFGSRFLPATKASPKEMLPIVDKPLIQYATEEAIAAGITDLIFVTGRSKRAIEDHFDKAYELENELELRGKSDLLKMAQSVVPENISCIYIRQTEALGLGHAVLCARPVVGDEPFAVILADDLIRAERPALRQMAEVFGHYNSSVIAVQEIARENSRQYGVVKTSPLDARVSRLDAIVEKPAPDAAPSNLGVVGRYILTPNIFEHLENIRAGSGGEIQLTDAIAVLLKQEQVLAYEFQGKRYDCGSKLGYLEATVEYALEHAELKDRFRQYLRTLKP